MTDIAEGPTEDAGGAEPAELQVEEPAAQQA